MNDSDYLDWLEQAFGDDDKAVIEQDLAEQQKLMEMME